jgi:hypothetical protein
MDPSPPSPLIKIRPIRQLSNNVCMTDKIAYSGDCNHEMENHVPEKWLSHFAREVV